MLHKENKDLNILFACDTDKSRPWYRDRLPSIDQAILNVEHSCKVVDIYSLLGSFQKSPKDIQHRKMFFQNTNLYSLNRNFQKNVMNFNPDILLLGTADNYRDFLLPKTISNLRERGVIVSGILGDDEFNYHQYRYFLGWFDIYVAYVKPCIDYYDKFELSKGYYLPNSCYLHSTEFPLHSDEPIYDAILIGSPIANRPEIVKALVEAGVNLAIYGSDQWNKYEYAKNSYHGYVDTKHFNQILAKSKIVLALLEDHVTGKVHMNTKIWEAVRVGRLPVITFYRPLIDDYKLKEGSNIVMYKDITDLVEKVKYYINNDMEGLKIAKNLYHRVFDDFNYSNLYQELFNTLANHEPEIKPPLSDMSSDIITEQLQQDHNAFYKLSSSIIDPCVLDIVKIIRLDKNECNTDLIYFNRIEKGMQVLQRKPFISFDSIIFLKPVNNKLQMSYILVTALITGRALHVKQFCIESQKRTLLGVINNIIDRSIYSQIGYKLRNILYKHDLIKSLIQKILKF